ncbi:MAG TPA: RHS repeat-associated core domain-containing protein, partial [Streptosporangiaceae bacterium]|nr:RHS repeat-associated core domain-containing protein [Streptosporangiaceae bacterium]
GTALLGSTDFDPFGQVRARSGLATSLGYQGEYTDPASGRVDMHARWYTPATGTFTSRDTADLTPDPSIQANRYTYAGADPLNFTDPTGHVPCPGDGETGTGGGGWQLASTDYTTMCYPTNPPKTGGGGGSGVSVGRGVITNPGHHHRTGGGNGGGGGGGGGGHHSSGPTPAQIQAALARKALITPAPRPPLENHITQSYLNKIRDQAEAHVKVEHSVMTPGPQPAFTPVDSNPQASPLTSTPSPSDITQPPNTADFCSDIICPGERFPGIPIPNPLAPAEKVFSDIGNTLWGGVKNIWNNWTWPTIVIIGAVIANAVAGDSDDDDSTSMGSGDEPSDAAWQGARHLQDESREEIRITPSQVLI